MLPKCGYTERLKNYVNYIQRSDRSEKLVELINGTHDIESISEQAVKAKLGSAAEGKAYVSADTARRKAILLDDLAKQYFK